MRTNRTMPAHLDTAGAQTSSLERGAASQPALPLEQAFRLCSDPDGLRYMDELKEYSVRRLLWYPGDPYVTMHHRWCDRRRPLKQAFVAKLRSGELIATGFAQPLTAASRRITIAPELFELLELDFERSEAEAGDLHFIRVEVSASEGVDPARRGTARRSAAHLGPANAEEFTHNADYTVVHMRGSVFMLSGGLCTIVKRLHEASRGPDPWLNGKKLLDEAEYGSMYMGSVFKRHRDPSWRELIESRRGYYRLNLKGG